jgi:hypothetical protein
MKKLLFISLILFVAVLGYWLISPFFIDSIVSEDFPIDRGELDAEPVLVATGSFVGFDRIHYGSGNVGLIETTVGYIIRFEEDFNVANGPDLFVGFGRDGSYIKGSEIGRLKGNIGSQNYSVPENIDIENFNEIWIWCRVFSTGFARAELVPRR